MTSVRPVPATLAASDWLVVIISTLSFILTRSRGEYLRVVGVHSDGRIDRDIYLVCYPFQTL